MFPEIFDYETNYYWGELVVKLVPMFGFKKYKAWEDELVWVFDTNKPDDGYHVPARNLSTVKYWCDSLTSGTVFSHCALIRAILTSFLRNTACLTNSGLRFKTPKVKSLTWTFLNFVMRSLMWMSTWTETSTTETHESFWTARHHDPANPGGHGHQNYDGNSLW